MNQKLLNIQKYVSKQSPKKRQTSEKPNISKYEIIKRHHRFIRESDSQDQDQKIISYEEELVKQKYDQLYKEYALADLTKYKIGKIGCRWRTKKQVLKSKGQKICGNVKCDQLATNIYQMNFGYTQSNYKKNALVKISVCKQCAVKLNFCKQLKRVQSSQQKHKQDQKYLQKQDQNLVKIQAND